MVGGKPPPPQLSPPCVPGAPIAGAVPPSAGKGSNGGIGGNIDIGSAAAPPTPCVGGPPAPNSGPIGGGMGVPPTGCDAGVC
mmetsp:Transcript_6485/g.16026  ORF Transcript_6485/g.16026 Transcript_6485/m.16026 type:complete len:82 (-) Transcript_6485:185-430(-)